MIKKYIPLFTAVILGLFFVIQSFTSLFDEYAKILRNWVIILSVFALILGVFNLLHKNFKRLKSGDGNGKIYSLVIIISFLITVSSGFVNWNRALFNSTNYFAEKPELIKKIVSEAISNDPYFSFYPAKEKLVLLISKDIVPYYIPDEKDLAESGFTLKHYLSFFNEESKLDPKLMNDSVFSKDAIGIKNLSLRIDGFSQTVTTAIIENKKETNIASIYGFKQDTELKIADFIKKDASIKRTDRKQTITWLFEVFYKPLSSAFFALLAFAIIAVVFKSFKLKNAFATIFVLSATVVLLGHISFGKIVADTVNVEELQFSALLDWLLFVPNMAAQRAILISTGLGICFYSLKLLLGIERPYDGEDDA